MAAQKFLGQGVLHVLLDRAFHLAGTVNLVIALFNEEVRAEASKVRVMFRSFKALLDIGKLDIDDLLDMALFQRMENNDVVNAVEEFRIEGLLQFGSRS